MTLTRRHLNVALSSSLLTPPLAMAAGEHGDGPFSTLERPFPTATPGKVEVIEFLWYGCPHCAKVEPYVEAWSRQLPADVVFRREHIVWEARPETVAHARLFATLRTMDILEKHQQAVFDAVHKDRVDFRKEAALADWAARRGIDRAEFDSMIKSFGIATQVTRLKTQTNTYKVEGVPTFIVNGKYITEPHRAGGEQQVLAVIDRLVAQERALLKR